MKSKTLHKDKVNIITLGCSKNLVDSEVLSGQLMANDIDVVHENTKLDHNVVVVNTCGFIDNAKQESIDTILQYANAKDNGLVDKLYVTGCLSERYKENLEEEKKEEVKEIIFALSTNMEGDTTNFYLFKKLAPFKINITCLSRGVAIGTELQYADELTLGRSLINRQPFNFCTC